MAYCASGRAGGAGSGRAWAVFPARAASLATQRYAILAQALEAFRLPIISHKMLSGILERGLLRLASIMLLAVALTISSSAYGESTPPETEKSPQPGIDFTVLPESMLAKSFSLDEDAQTYLWDIEHLAFVLSQDLLPVFREAIRDGSRDDLLRFLTPDFRARVFANEGRHLRQGLVKAELWQAGDPLERLDRESFVDTLVAYGRAYESVERVDMHMFYLSPSTRGDLSGAWEMRMDVRIAGTLPGGGRGERRFDCAMLFTKLSEDIAFEIGWIEDFELLRARRVSSPRPLLEEITDETGIDIAALSDNWRQQGPPYIPVPGSARLLDYDRDGRVDLLLTDINAARHLFLYRGLGDGTFEDVTEEVGLGLLARAGRRTWLTAVLVADLDNDGFEDLLIGVDTRDDQGQLQHAIALMRNGGGKNFEMIPESVHHLGKRFQLANRGMAVADYDGDGLVDLFLGPSGKRPPAEQQQVRWLNDRSSKDSVLLRNLGGFRFEDVTAVAGLAGEHIDTSSATWLDLEPDGDADLFLGNHMGANLLFENQGDGTFVKLPSPPGFGGFSMGAVAGDMDGDGDPDLYVANMYTSAGSRIIDNLAPEDYPEGVYELIRGFATGNELYENRGAGELRPLGRTVDVANSGWAYGPAVVDLDGDGRLDLYSPAGYQSVKRGEPDG